MADISLYLTNVNVSISQGMHADQPPSPHPGKGKDFESVELGDLGRREDGRGEPKEEKTPRRIIHFSSGETMEEYSTDEEEAEEREQEKRDLLAFPVDAVRSKMTWAPYFWFHVWRAATSTISACDYLGERMASLFGITSAKYQYAIDEYYRIKKEKEEENEENRLSEEAERSFDQSQCREEHDEPVTVADHLKVTAPNPDVTYQIENENQAPASTIRVPAIVMTT